MTVESFLTRELNVRFIDARNLATEAKLNLGYHDYPSQIQKEEIQAEACRIFGNRLSDDERSLMQEQNVELKTTKSLMNIRKNGSGSNASLSGSNRRYSESASSSVSSSTSSRRSRKAASYWLPGAAPRR